jgi:agmatinase
MFQTGPGDRRADAAGATSPGATPLERRGGRTMDSAISPRLTFLGLPDDEAYRRDAFFRILSVPYDLTQSGWTGARFGPAAILAASTQFEEYDPELGLEAARLGIATLGEIPQNVRGPEAMTEDIFRAASGLVAPGKFLASLGGDHTVSLGLVRAHLECHPDLGVVVLDAHTDLRDSYQGSPVGHATVMRRVSELAPVVTLGYRSLASEEKAFLEKGGVVAIPASGLKSDPVRAWARVASRVPRKVYLSIDIDMLDPSIMPAVGTPEPGGLSWEDANAFLDALAREREIVGMDLVELLPVPGLPAPNVAAAKLLYRVFGLIARSQKR